jgi:hypothetical protein
MLFINIILSFLIMLMSILLSHPKKVFLAVFGLFVILLSPLFLEHYICFVFVSFSFFMVLTVLQQKQDIFAPWNIFVCVWTFAVGLS